MGDNNRFNHKNHEIPAESMSKGKSGDKKRHDAVKPCPFDSSHEVDLYESGSGRDFNGVVIGCKDCGLSIISDESGKRFSTKQQAVEYWNDRGSLDEAIETIDHIYAVSKKQEWGQNYGNKISEIAKETLSNLRGEDDE